MPLVFLVPNLLQEISVVGLCQYLQPLQCLLLPNIRAAPLHMQLNGHSKMSQRVSATNPPVKCIVTQTLKRGSKNTPSSLS